MPRKKSNKEKPILDLNEVIAETGRRSYEMLRLSRIRYKDNPYNFMDLRIYHRGYDDDGNELRIPAETCH